jgi:hypothetical protein
MFIIPEGYSIPPITGTWTNWTGVANGANYIYGTAATVGVQMIDNTHFLLFFTNFSSGIFGCVYGTITGTNAVNYGTSIVLTNGSPDIPGTAISTCLLTGGAVVATWNATQSGGTINAYAIAINVTSSAIKAGTLLLLASNATSPQPNDITSLTSTTCAIAYRDVSMTSLMAVILSLSGSTLTPGTPTIIFGSGYGLPTISQFSAGNILFLCDQSVLGNAFLTATIVTYSGTSITGTGSPVGLKSFTSAGLLQINVAILTPVIAITSYIVVDGTGSRQESIYMNLTSGIVATLPAMVINAASATSINNAWLEPINNINAMVAYTYGSIVNANVLTLAGTVINVGMPVQIQSTPNSGALDQVLSLMDQRTIISCGIDGSNNAVTKVLKVN